MAKTFSRLTDVEHVKKRVEVYAGSQNPTVSTLQRFVSHTNMMTSEEIEHVPALLTILFEPLANCIDEARREGTNVRNISVTWNEHAGFSFRNDGNGIPIKQFGDDTDMLIPEVVFGHLRSGSNFDDETRDGVGKNGLGVKLTNIFSDTFRVRCVDENNSFDLTWRSGMTIFGRPSVVKRKARDTSGVLVECELGLLEEWTPAHVKAAKEWLHARMIESSFLCSSTKFTLNGIPLKDYRSVANFLKLYGVAINKDVVRELGSRTGGSVYFAIGALEDADAPSLMLSYVNCAATPLHGTHVELVKNHLYVFASGGEAPRGADLSEG